MARTIASVFCALIVPHPLDEIKMASLRKRRAFIAAFL